MPPSSVNQPDDYLTAIWQLTSPIGERPASRRSTTAPARIADLLGVSRPTVGDMLAKLEDRGLVTRGERKEALLTPAGQAAAMRAVRRFRVVLRFVVAELGYPLWEARERALLLVDGFDDDATERLYVHLGSPERSPNGFPIDPDHELRENAALSFTDRLADGTRGEVVRITERDGDIQRWLVERGIVPGTEVEAHRTLTGVELRSGSGAVELDPVHTRSVYLRPAGTPAVPATAQCWADILLRERAIVSASD